MSRGSEITFQRSVVILRVRTSFAWGFGRGEASKSEGRAAVDSDRSAPAAICDGVTSFGGRTRHDYWNRISSMSLRAMVSSSQTTAASMCSSIYVSSNAQNSRLNQGQRL